MVKCGVLFEVRSEFINIIYTSFGFKESMEIITVYSENHKETHKYTLCGQTAEFLIIKAGGTYIHSYCRVVKG
jgi:hypothetical protein